MHRMPPIMATVRIDPLWHCAEHARRVTTSSGEPSILYCRGRLRLFRVLDSRFWRAATIARANCGIGILMVELGKALLGLGLLLAVIGGVLLIASRFGLPLGRLPGDISYRGKNVSFFFPIGTSILISVVLSVIFYLISRFRR